MKLGFDMKKLLNFIFWNSIVIACLYHGILFKVSGCINVMNFLSIIFILEFLSSNSEKWKESQEKDSTFYEFSISMDFILCLFCVYHSYIFIGISIFLSALTSVQRHKSYLKNQEEKPLTESDQIKNRN
jgi:preprotein translocase subunit SecG